MRLLIPMKSVLVFASLRQQERRVREHLDRPSVPIQFLLGDEDQADPVEEHTPHALFIELSEFVSEKDKLQESSESYEHGWKETAR